MYQKLLDGAQIGSPLQQVGGEGVAQVVGAGERVQPGLPRSSLEDTEDLGAVERPAGTRQQEMVAVVVPNQRRSSNPEIPVQGLQCRLTEGQHALPAALAETARDAQFPIDVTEQLPSEL